MREFEDIYTARLESAEAGAATRIATYLAVLELCAELAHPLLDLPWVYRSPMSLVCNEMARASSEVDRAREAMVLLYSACAANQHRFWGRSADKAVEFVGAWPTDSTTEQWREIAVTSEFLASTLERAGYDVLPTVKNWRDRGWLRTEGKHLKPKIDMGSARPRLYAIRRKAIEEVAGDAPVGGAEPDWWGEVAV